VLHVTVLHVIVLHVTAYASKHISSTKVQGPPDSRLCESCLLTFDRNCRWAFERPDAQGEKTTIHGACGIQNS
jgi:hypothetical protein